MDGGRTPQGAAGREGARARRTVGRGAAFIATLALALGLASGAGGSPSAGAAAGQATKWVPWRANPPATVAWALGDSADGSSVAQQVASFVRSKPLDRFIYLGDVYDSGTAEEYATRYEPLWGPLAPRTAPVVGNHEWPNYDTGYAPYWRAVHGGPVPLAYSFVDSGWQLLALNSEADHALGSPQAKWLRTTLESTPSFGNCRIGLWHRPRYSASKHGNARDMQPIWRLLSGQARMVLNAHDHGMQRLKPIDGMVEFVSGAGGHGLYAIDANDPRLRFSDDRHYGGLRLNLTPGSAGWKFIAASGKVLDKGSLSCQPGAG